MPEDPPILRQGPAKLPPPSKYPATDRLLAGYPPEARQPKKPRDPSYLPGILAATLGTLAASYAWYAGDDPLWVRIGLTAIALFGVFATAYGLWDRSRPDPDPEADTLYPPVQLDDLYNEIPASADLPEPMPGSILNRFALSREDADPTIPPGNPTGIIPGRPGETIGPASAWEVFGEPLAALLRWLLAPDYAARVAKINREIAAQERKTKEALAAQLASRKAVGGPPRPTPPLDARTVNQRLYCPVCDDIRECRVYPDYRMAYCCDYHHWLPGRYPHQPATKPLEYIEK